MIDLVLMIVRFSHRPSTLDAKPTEFWVRWFWCFIESASRSPPGLVSCSWHFLMHLNHFGAPVRVHFATLGVTFEAFWGHFCTLEVIFGALWVYFLCPKTDWGAKGAPSGASPKIPSPFWVPFWCHFSIIFVFEGSIQRAFEKTSKQMLFWTGSNLEN